MDAVFQRALRGRLERVDDRGLAVASSSSTAETKKLAQRSPRPASAASTGAMSPWPSRGLADRGFERRAVALGHHRRGSSGSSPLSTPSKAAGEARIAARDAAGLVDGRDRHRRVLEEAHEAHFRRALRIAAVVLGAIEHQRARGAGRAVGAERHLVEQPHRHRLAAARLEVEVEHLGLHFARRGVERGQQRRASPATISASLSEPAPTCARS